MKNCVRAGLVMAVVGISCLLAKGQTSLAQGPFTQKGLPWSVSGADLAPDGTLYLVSDVDNKLYRYMFSEKHGHNFCEPVLIKKNDPIVLPVTHSGGETKSGLESVRYVNDSTFLFATEYDKPGVESASALYLGKLRGAKMILTEIVPDKCFSGTWANNSGIEGITLSIDRKSLWIVNERPFSEDASPARIDKVVRLTHLDFTGKVIEYIAYRLQPAAAFSEPGAFMDNGISEILMYDNDHILLLERAFAGTETCRTYGRVFMLDLRAARAYTDCESSVGPGETKASLVLDAGKTFPQAHIDNYECLTWGPVKDGQRTLMLLSDDNGNWTRQVCPQTTDLIVFDIK